MKITTVSDFRDHASGLLRSKDPILVTRRGRLTGVFFPRPETTLPIELKRELFSVLADDVRRRDPDDVEILALVLHTGLPVWSNDNEFTDAGVEWFTTAELLAKLGAGSD
jgi:hypothetical protein